MTTLVTGGTGLIGFNIIKLLLEQGRTVRALVRSLEKGQRLLPKECELVQGDITDIDSIRTAMKDCSIVYHAAGFPEQWMKDDAIFQEINTEGTRNMVQVALEQKVKRFVYTSTIDVFQGKAHEIYDESVLDPNPKHTAYERSKQDADQIVTNALKEELPVVFLHPSAVYGPGPSSSEGVNSLIQKIRDKDLPVLLPGGMPFVYAEDVARGHILAEEKAKVGERFILSEQYSCLKDFTKAVQEIEKMPIKIPSVLPYSIAKIISAIGTAFAKITHKAPLIQKGQLTFLQWQAIPDSSKAQKELGWKPLSIREGVRRTIESMN